MISVHRVARIVVGADDVLVVLRGDPGEAVQLEVAVEAQNGSEWSVHSVHCVFGRSGEVTARLIAQKCDAQELSESMQAA